LTFSVLDWSSALNRSQTIDARRAAAASSWTRRALGHAFEGDPTCLDQVRATRGTDCRPAERHGEVIFQSLDHATARPHGRQPASPISRPLRRALPGTPLGTDVEPVAKSSVRCHIPDSGRVLPIWHLVPHASFTANVTAGQTTTPQPLRGAAADAGSRQCGRIESHVVDRRVQGAFGISPAEYLVRACMRESLRRLRKRGMTVEEAARRCGYQSVGRFRTRVRRATGLTPSQIRQLEECKFDALLEDRFSLLSHTTGPSRSAPDGLTSKPPALC
jgi:AraC-like DNA-binding protein